MNKRDVFFKLFGVLVIIVLLFSCAPKKSDEQLALEARVAELQAELELLSQIEAQAELGIELTPEQTARIAELQAEIVIAQGELDVVIAEQRQRSRSGQPVEIETTTGGHIQSPDRDEQPLSLLEPPSSTVQIPTIPGDYTSPHYSKALTVTQMPQTDSQGLFYIPINNGREYAVTAIIVMNERLIQSTASGSIVIPALFNGLPVTTIPDGTGSRFVDYNLSDTAFCSQSITNISFASGSRITHIGTRAFTDSAITSITLPPSLTTVGPYAFYSNKTIVTVTIPEGVTSIGSYAFLWCSNLTTVNLPSTLTSVGRQTFAICEKLVNITIPSSLTSIGDAAFTHTAITSLTVPSGVTNFGRNAFGHNSNLRNVTLSPGLTAIGELAFTDTGITNITIPSSVRTIGLMAFENTKLTSITIPSSVTNIGKDAFKDCRDLRTVTIESNLSFRAAEIFLNTRDVHFIFANNITTIHNNMFTNYRGISRITIPASVTSIGNEAFQDCVNLFRIIFENGSQLTRIGDRAFQRTIIMDFNIPSTVTYIGANAFDVNNIVFVSIQARISDSMIRAANFPGNFAELYITNGHNMIYTQITEESGHGTGRWEVRVDPNIRDATLRGPGERTGGR